MSNSARCSQCQTCAVASLHQKPKEVIYCPLMAQYRATSIFRSCDYFVSAEAVNKRSAEIVAPGRSALGV